MTELLALLVTPLSGPLAGFGGAGASALRLWAAEAADLPQPWRGVRVELHDAHPDPAVAMRRGLASRPHLVFGPYGSGPTLQALGATERVVWNHGGASSRICWPAFPLAVNVLAPASSYFRGTLEAVRAADPQARRVVMFHATTGFGSDIARGAAESAAELGFAITPIDFPTGKAERAADRVPEAEVLLVAGGFDDELSAAVKLLARPWRAASFVGAGVDEVLDSLGEAREGLVGPAQWIAAAAPQPDEGPDAGWFANRYRHTVGGDPSYPAVQAFAAGLLAARCFRDAKSVDDEAQVAAARNLACRTLYGEFRLHLDTGRQVGHRILTVQWQQGRRRVIWPPDRAEAALRYPLERVGRQV